MQGEGEKGTFDIMDVCDFIFFFSLIGRYGTGIDILV
jgi:hypothetical protein